MTTNKFSGKCVDCGERVEAGAGLLNKVETPSPGTVLGKVIRWDVHCADPVQCDARKAAAALALAVAHETLATEALTKSLNLAALERCCDCARALKDPVSVEDGIGPICRVKSAYQPNDVAETLRPLARAAVRTIAHFQKGPEVLHALDVIRSLNFPKLAERIEARLSAVQVTQPEGLVCFTVSHKHDPSLYYRLVHVPGWTYDRKNSRHVIPLSEGQALEKALSGGPFRTLIYWQDKGLMVAEAGRLEVVGTHLDVPTLERMAAALAASSKPACQQLGSQIAQLASGQAANDAIPDWRPPVHIAEDYYAG